MGVSVRALALLGDAFPPSGHEAKERKAKLPVLTSCQEPKQRENGSAADSSAALGTAPGMVGRVGVPGMRILPLCSSHGHLWAMLLVLPASTGFRAGQGHTLGASILVCAQGPCGAPGEPGQKGQRGYMVSGGCEDIWKG